MQVTRKFHKVRSKKDFKKQLTGGKSTPPGSLSLRP